MKKCLHKHLGARNELIACAWLLNEGYEVFRNVSAHGIMDLIVMRDGQITFLDVKSAHYGKDGKPNSSGNRLKRDQVEAGVKRFNVYLDGRCEIVSDPAILSAVFPARVCACGKQFIPKRTDNIWCSRKCCTDSWAGRK